LFVAAGRGNGWHADAEKLERLLDAHKGALDINATDPENPSGSEKTALGYAARLGLADAANVLLRRGADVNRYDADPAARPLMAAAKYGHADVVRALCKAGAKINEVEAASGMTALHAATRGGHTAAVRVLLECGADARVEDRGGITAAEVAAGPGKTELAAVFSEFGAGKSAAAGLSVRSPSQLAPSSSPTSPQSAAGGGSSSSPASPQGSGAGSLSGGGGSSSGGGEKPAVAELRALFAALDMSEFVDACLAEAVTVSDLRTLGKEELKELIPKMGPRARLLAYFAEHKQTV
jgi:uncharacterized membrane protein YgcG